jgi:thiamine biosynthesis lipoprotein ApbE
MLMEHRRKDSWVIGLQHPRKSEGLLGSFEIRDKAVSTSGDYENSLLLMASDIHT